MSFDERKVVAHVERLTLKELRLWVREGWVRPAYDAAGPVFDELDIARVRLLCDLRKDLSLSADVLPIVLTLIDRLHQTRRELHALAKALEEQPEDVRRTVASRLQSIRSRAGEADDTAGEAS